MKGRVFDIAVAVLIVAMVYVLVRPASKGTELVTSITAAVSAIVRNAADLGSPQGVSP